MTLTDRQKRRIEDVALGKSINGRKSIENQIAALRKQVITISAAVKVPLVTDLQELEDLVAEERAKQSVSLNVKDQHKTSKI